MRIGSTIAAALTGEATSDSIGMRERTQGPKTRPLTGRTGSPPGSPQGRIAFRPTFILFSRAPALGHCALRPVRRCVRTREARQSARDDDAPEFGGDGSETMTSGYRQTYDQWRADPQAFWAEAAREIAWIRPPERIFDPEGGVYGRWFPDARVQRLLQRARPACRGRPRRSGRALLRQPRRQDQADHHLPRTARRDGDARRRARGSRRRGGRPGADLHADDSRGDRRHARLRAHRRRPFGGVRRVRRQGAGDPHRRRRAEGGFDGELRHRARPDRRI